MIRVLGIDPGGRPSNSRSRSATGWSLWEYDALTPLRPIAHGQIRGNQTTFIRWWAVEGEALGADEIVCESFQLDGRTQYPDVTPLKVEGFLEGQAIATGIPLVFQPNGLKVHLRDERIKELGLWWKGEPHAMDSMRHVFACQKLRRHQPTIRMAWPPRVSAA